MKMRPLRLAVIWSRFGPYHLARLRGAAKAMPGARIVGVEVAAADRDYAWDIEHGADSFERVTVFAGANYHDLAHGQIAERIQASLNQIQPDAVAINGWSVPEARAALGWSRKHGVSTILMSETKADDIERTWWKEAVKRIVVRRFDAAIVGGRLQVEYLSALGFSGEHIRLGYDAIDNAYFEARSDEARKRSVSLRAELGLPENYFLACTRFLRRKNMDGLLRAYARYHAATSEPWGLVIAGSGEEEQPLRQLALGLGIAKAVVWPGFVQYPKLPSYFGLASAFVHPAKSEAWGLVVNEAAASGTPLLVARTVGASAELVREGETGLLIDPNNDDDIVRVLSAITAMSKVDRERLGKNARNLVACWGPERFGTELAASISSIPVGRVAYARHR